MFAYLANCSLGTSKYNNQRPTQQYYETLMVVLCWCSFGILNGFAFGWPSQGLTLQPSAGRGCCGYHGPHGAMRLRDRAVKEPVFAALGRSKGLRNNLTLQSLRIRRAAGRREYNTWALCESVGSTQVQENVVASCSGRTSESPNVYIAFLQRRSLSASLMAAPFFLSWSHNGSGGFELTAA